MRLCLLRPAPRDRWEHPSNGGQVVRNCAPRAPLMGAPGRAKWCAPAHHSSPKRGVRAESLNVGRMPAWRFILSWRRATRRLASSPHCWTR